jgi:serine/threonine-protein kinase
MTAERPASRTVAIADDATLLRDGIELILSSAGYDVVASVGDADSLIDCVRASQPDVVIVDIRMPPTHSTEGLEAAVSIRSTWPDTGIVVLSQYVEPRYAIELLNTDAPGGLGYLLKDRISDSRAFIDSVSHGAAGGSSIDPTVVAQLLGRPRRDDPLATLSDRERDVLALMAEGRSNRAIADRLHISIRTLEKHTAGIFRKLGLHDQPDDHRRVLAVLSYLRRT